MEGGKNDKNFRSYWITPGFVRPLCMGHFLSQNKNIRCLAISKVTLAQGKIFPWMLPKEVIITSKAIKPTPDWPALIAGFLIMPEQITPPVTKETVAHRFSLRVIVGVTGMFYFKKWCPFIVESFLNNALLLFGPG